MTKPLQTAKARRRRFERYGRKPFARVTVLLAVVALLVVASLALVSLDVLPSLEHYGRSLLA